jgi:hypothetical protein
MTSCLSLRTLAMVELEGGAFGRRDYFTRHVTCARVLFLSTFKSPLRATIFFSNKTIVEHDFLTKHEHPNLPW